MQTFKSNQIIGVREEFFLLTTCQNTALRFTIWLNNRDLNWCFLKWLWCWRQGVPELGILTGTLFTFTSPPLLCKTEIVLSLCREACWGTDSRGALQVELSRVSHHADVRVLYMSVYLAPDTPPLWFISVLLSQIINGLNLVPLFESKEVRSGRQVGAHYYSKASR